MRDERFTLSKISTYKNMPDLVAESLKEAIMRGEFKGGMQLKQDEIAKQFDVSLIPVREALIQLEGMHLVKCIRNKGALVTTLSFEEMKQLFELRKVLETGSLLLMKGPISEAYLDKMEMLVKKIEDTEDLFTFSKYNRLFYLLLCDGIGNLELTRMYEKLFVRVERYLNYIFYMVPTLREDKTHYRYVLHLLREDEKDTLQEVLQAHIEMSHQAFIHTIERVYKDTEHFDWNTLLPFE